MLRAEKPRLESWKAIADHLKRDERTAMRWAKLGMPVHREPGLTRGRVYAYAKEIDAWIGTGNFIRIEEARATLTEKLQPPSCQPRRVSARIHVGLMVAITSALCVSASLAFKAVSATALSHVTLEHDHFVAVTAKGRALWSYPLPVSALPILADTTPGIAYVGDLLGDARKEVLVSVPYPKAPAGSEYERQLYCFSETGELLWRFDPNEKVRFGDSDYGPPWIIRRWLLYHFKGEVRIALALTHHIWWPSILVTLNGRGKEIGEFVNAGDILQLASANTSLGQVLLIAGLSNSHGREGFLAALDAANPIGGSPELPGSTYQCTSCSQDRPLRYFIFPQSELNEISAMGQNFVVRLQAMQDRVELETEELPTQTVNAQGMFEFDLNLQIKRASWSDGYAIAHRQLEREGKIGHVWEHCPDNRGPRSIRSWDALHGWSEVRLR